MLKVFLLNFKVEVGNILNESLQLHMECSLINWSMLHYIMEIPRYKCYPLKLKPFGPPNPSIVCPIDVHICFLFVPFLFFIL